GCGVIDDPVGGGDRSGWAVCGRRDDDVPPALFAIGIEQDASARAVGGHTELASGILEEPPGGQEITVGVRSQPPKVRTQRGFDETARRGAIFQALDPEMTTSGSGATAKEHEIASNKGESLIEEVTVVRNRDAVSAGPRPSGPRCFLSLTAQRTRTGIPT